MEDGDFAPVTPSRPRTNGHNGQAPRKEKTKLSPYRRQVEVPPSPGQEGCNRHYRLLYQNGRRGGVNVRLTY